MPRVQRRGRHSGRVVLITGGARGIGRATAAALTLEGASVALADVDVDAARETARTIPGAAPFEVDVADRRSFAALLRAVQADLGPLDVLVNNAAVMALAPFLEVGEAVIRRQLEVNLMGVVHGMQLALPEMVQRGRGHVVNVNSGAGKWGIPGENAYVASKHAVVGLSDVIRRELRSSGVDVSLVLMGPVRDTDLAAGMPSAGWIRKVAPEEVATAISSALQRPRFEVWVPRWLGWLEAIGHITPRTLRGRFERASGLERVGTSIDRAQRAGYEQRVFGESVHRPSQPVRPPDAMMASLTDTNRAVIRRFYDELWNRWDLSVAEEIVAPDVHFRGSLGTTLNGIDAFKRYVEQIHTAFPDWHNRIDELIAEGETVVARMTWRGTHRGKLLGVPPTRRRVTYVGAAIFRLDDAKIQVGWVVGDTQELWRALGVLAVPGE